MLKDTIIAISTPPGYGGLGIVRLSGRRAAAIAKALFRPARRIDGAFPVGTAVFGRLYDGEKKELYDEAFLLFHKAPHSYTKEDVVEISCHGSPVVLEETVHLGTKAGARLAHPGEFTLRAYLNGRLDILEAEAVNDLIRATSLVQARISFRQMSGSLSKRIGQLRESLLRLAGQVEAAIEFPEEGLRLTGADHSRALDRASRDIEDLAESYEKGRALSQGVTVALVGRTNVGKSTLFNALLETERAIVTPFPGTTRDYLREDLVVKDTVFHLVDMAGLERAGNRAEKQGIQKGRRIAAEADGILLVVDGSSPESPEDLALVRRFSAKKMILVVNKADLAPRLDIARLRTAAPDATVVVVSALRHRNLDGLKESLHGRVGPAGEFPEELVLHARQRDSLRDITQLLKAARELLMAGQPEEVYAEELRKALAEIGRLTGEIRSDEVMDDIFKRFCVGK
jgi:tRNA modification GTPase